MNDQPLAARIPFPVKLSWLAGLDATCVSGSLADAVGDNYLCAHNPVFAALRLAALSYGFRFSAADTPLWRDYCAIPMVTIDRIIEGGVIPYFDTWGSLRRMMEANAKAAMPIYMLVRQLRHNHTLHEAAHCIAHAVLAGLENELSALCASPRHAEVVQSVIGESFANAIEMTGTEYLHDPIVDDIFYSLNSYMVPTEKSTGRLKLAAEAWGAARRFAVLFAAYFESNVTPNDPDSEVLERAAETAGLEGADAGLLSGIVKTAYNLNKGFRDQTTPYYFERRGLGKEAREVFASRWLADRDHRMFIGFFLEKVGPLIVSGQSMPQHRATTPQTTC